MAEIEQHPARSDWLRHDLALIPPLAKEFSVYGGDGTVARARDWALDGRYLLARGIPICAHGFYLLGTCPGRCSSQDFMDHANIWVPADLPAERPFLLSQPYGDEAPGAFAYAEAHGLNAQINYPGDNWYGSGTIAVRISVPEDWPMWPIEQLATVLLASQPVRWPEPGES